jgi:hypothetical protein
MAGMTEADRAERTARLLTARLEDVARAAAGLPHGRAERLVELASVATLHAVELELLGAEKADEIWHEAHMRHPQLPDVPVEVPVRLAA